MNTLLKNYTNMAKELFEEFKDNIDYELIPRFSSHTMASDITNTNEIVNSDYSLEYVLGTIINTCCKYSQSYLYKDNIEKFETWFLKLMLLADLYEKRIFTLKKWNKFFKRHKVKLNGITDISYLPNILNKLLEGITC